MSAALARHDEVARAVIAEHHGDLLKHTGDGVLAVFGDPADALRAAVAMQRAVPDAVPMRAGIHIGPAEARDGDYFGPTLNRAARIMGVARGGQVLVSADVARLVGDDVPPSCSLRDVGAHPLKDFERPERLFQAVGEGLSDESVSGPSRLAALGGRSSFVGREADVAELESLLATERLLTLTGVGGTGKTRLAYEVAARADARFADGVFVVELASLADPGDLARAVAGSVEMPVVATRVDDDLAIFLRTRRCLIVLDNCEHVLEECADLVDRLLAACPDLAILTTSREALAIEGERAWRVPSLSLPDAREPLACDAAVLFVARARGARADFAPEDHVAAIAEICRRLDGLPLAIELAAARVAHLTPEQIAAMLDDRFRLLTGGTRRARQRQQTLQAAMDWSYDLLSDDEQRLLRRLSVFAGGCTLDAATAVCADAGDPLGAIDALGSLVDKSLVVADDADGSEMRYRMLETVRLYGQDRLVEAGEAETLRNRHRDWMLDFLDAVVEPSRPGNFSRSAIRIESELDNLRAALEWSREQQRPDLVAILVARSYSMWYIGLHSDEGSRWLEPVVDEADAMLPLEDRVAWRAALSAFAQERMDGITMLRRSREATALDADNVVHLTSFAWACQVQVLLFNDVVRGVQLAEVATRAVNGHDNPDGERWLALFTAGGKALSGDLEAARSMLEDIVDASDTDVYTAAFSTLSLVAVLHVAGDDGEAARRVARMIDVLSFLPGRHIDVLSHALQAVVETRRGNVTAAREALATAIDRVRDRYTHIPNAWGIPVVAAGVMHALEGRDADAMRLLVGAGAGARFWQLRAEPTYLLHRWYTARLAERMPPDEFASSWAAGEQTTSEELIDAVTTLADRA